MPSRVSDDVILDAVVEAVIDHGYGGATTQRMAAAAGVNEVTLFRRFANKRGAVLAAIHRDIAELTRPGLEATGDLEADLLSVLEYYARIFRLRAGLPLTLILEVTRNPELAHLMDEPRAAQLALREMIASHQRAGALEAEPPQDAVNALIGPLLARAVDDQLGMAGGEPPSPARLLERFLRGHGTRLA